MRLGSKPAAFAWGLAEATVFFIVPDVLLTCLGLKSLKQALTASVFAALGATLGGVVIWQLSHSAPDWTMSILQQVPGISNATVQQVQSLLQQGTYQGMVIGAFSGVPFKVFAAEAGRQGINPGLFAVLIPAARLPRFIILSFTAWALSKAIGHHLSSRHKLLLTLVLWTVFYMAYFSVVG